MHDKHVRMPMLTRIGKTTTSRRQRANDNARKRNLGIVISRDCILKQRYVFQRCFMLPNELKDDTWKENL